jgi:DNA-binding CsgD family transcriptional regulator
MSAEAGDQLRRRRPPAALQRAERSLLCPVLIEREREFDALRSALDRLERAEGGVAVLVGEAGVGKTRLAREACALARSGGFTVLSGRAVPGASPVPYRPLTEAFLSAFRSAGPTEAPELAGFGGQLGRLVPAWGTGGGGADESPVLLGEAVVRLLRLVGAERGSVLLLEDLHWADVETLAVVEYLADALWAEPVLCLCTTRPEGAGVPVLSRLRRADGVTVLGLDRLSRAGVERAVASCLAADTAPADVLECVAANSEGNPFLVEELLAGLVTSGALRLAEDRWESTGRLTPAIPFDFGESVRNRLGALDDCARRVVQAAALLGRRFDWELLPGLAEVDGRAVVDALRLAVDAQIVEVDGNNFRFRHALSREAVLAELLPPERRDLARRALPAVERAHPGLPGGWCELVAELAVAAGDDASAARHLAESARRALAGGALASAESIAARARGLAADPGLIDDVDDVLVRALTLAGKPTEAAAIGDALVGRLSDREPDSLDAERMADTLVVLARAALIAGDAERANTMIGRARRLLTDDTDDTGVGTVVALSARVEAVAAHVALEQGRLADARALGQAAVDHARATGQPAVECEALEVLGRVSRGGAGDGAEFFERGAALAERHGLTTWLIRVRQELAMVTAVTTGDRQPLVDVRELAAANGALVTVAVMDLVLADLALASFDRAACLEHGRRAVDASRPYRLATLPVAHLWLAGAHALADDAEAMEAAAARARQPDPDDPRILGDLWGRVRATLAIVRDDREALRHALDTMMPFVRAAPVTTSVFLNRLLWALVHTIEDDDHGAAARAEVAAATTHLRSLPAFVHISAMVEAVAAGRRGHRDEATARYAAAASALAEPTFPGTVHVVHLLAAEAAVRDGWGEPARWLRRSEAFFADGGYHRLARRCRSALAAAGAPVPRRGRSTVPPALRAIGITSRELDVLALVAEGLSNRQIAERLFLSPKTVERHMSSLFDRTGVRERGALRDFARQYG